MAMDKKKLAAFAGATTKPPKGKPDSDGDEDLGHPMSDEPEAFAGEETPEEEAMEADMDPESALVAAAVQRVEQGKADQQLKSLMGEYDGESEGGTAPHWASDEDKWSEAMSMVDPDGDGADMVQPWLVVAEVYKALGGPIGKGGDDAPAEDDAGDEPMDDGDAPPEESNDSDSDSEYA